MQSVPQLFEVSDPAAPGAPPYPPGTSPQVPVERHHGGRIHETRQQRSKHRIKPVEKHYYSWILAHFTEIFTLPAGDVF